MCAQQIDGGGAEGPAGKAEGGLASSLRTLKRSSVSSEPERVDPVLPEASLSSAIDGCRAICLLSPAAKPLGGLNRDRERASASVLLCRPNVLTLNALISSTFAQRGRRRRLSMNSRQSAFPVGQTGGAGRRIRPGRVIAPAVLLHRSFHLAGRRAVLLRRQTLARAIHRADFRLVGQRQRHP